MTSIHPKKILQAVVVASVLSLAFSIAAISMIYTKSEKPQSVVFEKSEVNAKKTLKKSANENEIISESQSAAAASLKKEKEIKEIMKTGIIGEEIVVNNEPGKTANGEKTSGDGKTTETASNQNPQIPALISNTSGTVTAAEGYRLIVDGNGRNFVDGKPRSLTLIYAPETTTIISSSARYKGAEGLKYLKIGDKILIEGEGNIRGKTEFKVININLIK